MTRRDYALMADRLHDCFRDTILNSNNPDKDEGFKAAIIALSYALKSDNPRFDETKFFEACIR